MRSSLNTFRRRCTMGGEGWREAVLDISGSNLQQNERQSACRKLEEEPAVQTNVMCLMKVAARGESQVSERCSTWQRACLERADKIGLCRCLCHPQLLSSPPIKLDARSSHPRRAAVMSSLPFPPFAVKGQRRQGRVSMSETCPECSLRGSSRHFCRTSPWRSFCSPPLSAEASRSNRNY